ncbi:hypothetical protein CBR_g39070 [Chara braunii]|uniref:DDE Tnp4 domain-containing protein n=1 Tax=Chara braunii TaxID=69332 RepID=A0A388LQV4_CHABU|nr:hypothetical protein CBR_g39070 [Chara braunii]|eukprot:GBG84694.1 hypothetical protein CBR_g39070 [Chara braunii]
MAERVPRLSEEMQCIIFSGKFLGYEAMVLTRGGAPGRKTSWEMIKRNLASGDLDEVFHHQVKMDRKKRKEVSAIQGADLALGGVLSSVVFQLKEMKEQMAPGKVMAVGQVTNKRRISSRDKDTNKDKVKVEAEEEEIVKEEEGSEEEDTADKEGTEAVKKTLSQGTIISWSIFKGIRKGQMVRNVTTAMLRVYGDKRLWPTRVWKHVVLRVFLDKGFPNCHGTVDCTHIYVDKPANERSENFFDRKHRFSTIAQEVVDLDLSVLNVFVGYPENCHDIRVIQLSRLSRRAEEGMLFHGPPVTLPGGVRTNGYFLGDNGYPPSEWVVVPYGGINKHIDEESFDRKQKVARGAVERAFRRLKGMWRLFLRTHKMILDTLPQQFTVVCILHNILLDTGIEFDENLLWEVEENGVRRRLDLGIHHPPPVCRNGSKVSLPSSEREISRLKERNESPLATPAPRNRVSGVENRPPKAPEKRSREDGMSKVHRRTKKRITYKKDRMVEMIDLRISDNMQSASREEAEEEHDQSISEKSDGEKNEATSDEGGDSETSDEHSRDTHDADDEDGRSSDGIAQDKGGDGAGEDDRTVDGRESSPSPRRTRRTREPESGGEGDAADSPSIDRQIVRHDNAVQKDGTNSQRKVCGTRGGQQQAKQESGVFSKKMKDRLFRSVAKAFAFSAAKDATLYPIEDEFFMALQTMAKLIGENAEEELRSHVAECGIQAVIRECNKMMTTVRGEMTWQLKHWFWDEKGIPLVRSQQTDHQVPTRNKMRADMKENKTWRRSGDDPWGTPTFKTTLTKVFQMRRDGVNLGVTLQQLAFAEMVLQCEIEQTTKTSRAAEQIGKLVSIKQDIASSVHSRDTVMSFSIFKLDHAVSVAEKAAALFRAGVPSVHRTRPHNTTITNDDFDLEFIAPLHERSRDGEWDTESLCARP